MRKASRKRRSHRLRRNDARPPGITWNKNCHFEFLEDRHLLFGSAVHPDITLNALEFMRADVMSDINDEHGFQDAAGQLVQSNHFDGSHFREAASNINNWYREALSNASPTNYHADEIADSFGRILHAVQDFYAHSNWVELQEAGLISPTALLDRSEGFFDDLLPYSIHAGAMLVQGENEKPFGPLSSVTRNDNELVVTVNTGNHVFPGVITGSVWLGDDTPDRVAAPHGGIAGDLSRGPALAKDTTDSPLFSKARELAVAQTKHEFYRLLNLVEDYAGPSQQQRLITDWVNPQKKNVFDQLMTDEANGSNGLQELEQQLKDRKITGATIITHGFEVNDLDGDSLEPLALAIQQRAGGWLVDFDIPEVGASSIIHTNYVETGPGNEVVVLFDWALESNKSSNGWGEAAGDALFASLVDLGLVNLSCVQPTLVTCVPSVPLHFIGHSFGAAVTSEAVERLAAFKVPVDQVTYLDPHDFDQKILPVDGSQQLFTLGSPTGYGASVWNNVTFADAYYQTESAPDGRPIPGAANFDVTDHALVTFPRSHLDVWDNFYLDTVLNANSHDGYALSRVANNSSRPAPRFFGAAQDHEHSEGYLVDTDSGLANDALTRAGHSEPSITNARWEPLWNPLEVVGGNFDVGLSRDDILPGWSHHGGGGSGDLQRDAVTNNRALKLDATHSERTHNCFYVPKFASAMTLRARADSSNNQTLKVYFGSDSEASSTIPLPGGKKSSQAYIVSIPEKYRGSSTTVTVRRETVGSAGAILIDDVRMMQGTATGDVLQLDLRDPFPFAKSFSFTDGAVLARPSITLEGKDDPQIPLEVRENPLRHDWELWNANQRIATLIFSDRFDEQPFADSGTLLLAPTTEDGIPEDLAANPPERGFQGVLTLKVIVDGHVKEIPLAVSPGYNRSAGVVADASGAAEVSSRVTTDLGVTNIVRLQQRLNYLGFSDGDGQPLVVDGILGPKSKAALGLFAAAINADMLSKPELAMPLLDKTVVAWLNSPGAPRWTSLKSSEPAGTLPVLRFGTNWVIDTISSVQTKLSGNQEVVTLTPAAWSSVAQSAAVGMTAQMRVSGSTPATIATELVNLATAVQQQALAQWGGAVLEDTRSA